MAAGSPSRKQHDDRVTIMAQKIEIGGAQRAGEKLVAHRPAIDIDKLHLRICTIESRERSEPRQAKALALGLDLHGVVDEVLAQHLREAACAPGAIRRAGGIIETAAAAEAEGDLRMRHGEALHDVGDSQSLRAVRPQKFEPRRRRREEIARLDLRASRPIARPDGVLLAGFDSEGKAVRRSARARLNAQIRDCGDRGQRLAAKAERLDMRQIAVGNFGGRMAFDRKQQIRLIHAAAVIDDADESSSAVLDGDVDLFGAGVERVFDELLHGGARPFDHLASGDAVDQNRVEATDGHGELRKQGPPL